MKHIIIITDYSALSFFMINYGIVQNKHKMFLQS